WHGGGLFRRTDRQSLDALNRYCLCVSGHLVFYHHDYGIARYMDWAAAEWHGTLVCRVGARNVGDGGAFDARTSLGGQRTRLCRGSAQYRLQQWAHYAAAYFTQFACAYHRRGGIHRTRFDFGRSYFGVLGHRHSPDDRPQRVVPHQLGHTAARRARCLAISSVAPDCACRLYRHDHAGVYVYRRRAARRARPDDEGTHVKSIMSNVKPSFRANERGFLISLHGSG